MNQHTMREKFQTIPLIALAIALMVHILFFTLTSLQIASVKADPKTEIAFFGAILDSFEVEKLDSTKNRTPDVSTILAKPNSAAGRSVTAADKPHFTQEVNIKPKNFVKNSIFHEKTNEKIQIAPADKISPTPIEPQPYQRLRLYR
jgi:hypothetical protein